MQFFKCDQCLEDETVINILFFSFFLYLSNAATKTTLDDLMETLKKLEEDEKLPNEMDKNQTPQNWCKSKNLAIYL